MSAGKVYLIGGGPGDPGLLTLRGRDVLAAADVVVYDRLIPEELLRHARPEAETIYVGKQPGKHSMKQPEITALLVDLAKRPARVVRLKGGDPFVFGRGGEEALALAREGIAFEVVPGVSAGVAVPAYAGIPVTHRGLASNFGMITGHEEPGKEESDLDYAALARWGGTLEFFMGVGNLPEICRQLIDNGLDDTTPAAIIQQGATPRQRTVVGTLATLPTLAEQADIRPPALTVIGSVVGLRDKLVWYESRPLFGKSIVVTRARAQASRLSAALRELGAEVVEMPSIKIEPPEDPTPLRNALQDLEQFDWTIFTSVNAVDSVFETLRASGRDARAFAGGNVCAIGPATRAALAANGILADAQPPKYICTSIVETLAARESLSGKRILAPRADIAPPDLVDLLGAQGADVTEVTAYRTLPDCSGAQAVIERIRANDLDWITFTSSSTVRNFLTAVPADLLTGSGTRLVSIGPSTSETLREFGLEPSAQADPFTIDGVVNAVVCFEQSLEESS